MNQLVEPTLNDWIKGQLAKKKPSNVGGSCAFFLQTNRLLWGHFRLNAAVISPGVGP